MSRSQSPSQGTDATSLSTVLVHVERVHAALALARPERAQFMVVLANTRVENSLPVFLKLRPFLFKSLRTLLNFDRVTSGRRVATPSASFRALSYRFS